MCRALRVLSKNKNFDLCQLLERIQVCFDGEVRDEPPECHEKRLALKLTREAVADIEFVPLPPVKARGLPASNSEASQPPCDVVLAVHLAGEALRGKLRKRRGLPHRQPNCHHSPRMRKAGVPFLSFSFCLFPFLSNFGMSFVRPDPPAASKV